MIYKFPYRWTLKESVFTKDKGTVFSCFGGGGGSTMGYKLAGFDVLGCNEIDPKMMKCYIQNHNPKFSFLEPIQTFKDRDDLPKELYNLDILDGSPPCSSFSTAGKRDKDWGKKKKFKEGQAAQVLDTIFFDFIYLAKKLQPKIIIAENVRGLLIGQAKSYLKRIISAFIDAGYRVDYKLIDSSKMGIPQKRPRVFFYAVRRDIQCETIDLFKERPRLDLLFKEQVIPYREIEDINAQEGADPVYPGVKKMWHRTKAGCEMIRDSGKGAIGHYIINRDKPLSTILADTRLGGVGGYHYKICRRLTNNEIILAGSFPLDYDFKEQRVTPIIGMSVPPVMMAQVASRVYDQWLRKK